MTRGPNFQVDHLTNKHGKRITRFRFKSLVELEVFFMSDLIGSELMKDSSSIVIGTTLLIWDSNKTTKGKTNGKSI